MPETPPDPKAERARRAHDHILLFDTINGAEAHGSWLAISLSDGACDMRAYPTKADAVRFQLHETQCAYLCLTGIPTLGEVRLFLDTCEALYDADLTLADPATYVNPEALL
jgi:hypothetical protein